MRSTDKEKKFFAEKKTHFSGACTPNICRGLVHTYLCDFEIVCISFFQLYLTFHTYGQYILYPWGYARRDAVDKKDLHRMGKIGANAAKRVSGHKYSVGSAAKMLYPAAGMSIFFFTEI